MLYATAARLDELLSLRIGDIYFNSQKPYAVITGKGGKIRTLYLLPKAVSFLDLKSGVWRVLWICEALQNNSQSSYPFL